MRYVVTSMFIKLSSKVTIRESVVFFQDMFTSAAKEHVEFRDRIHKSLYYGQYSDKSLPSLAVTGTAKLFSLCSLVSFIILLVCFYVLCACIFSPCNYAHNFHRRCCGGAQFCCTSQRETSGNKLCRGCIKVDSDQLCLCQENYFNCNSVIWDRSSDRRKSYPRLGGSGV